jgi:hypothetical protein
MKRDERVTNANRRANDRVSSSHSRMNPVRSGLRPSAGPSPDESLRLGACRNELCPRGTPGFCSQINLGRAGTAHLGYQAVHDQGSAFQFGLPLAPYGLPRPGTGIGACPVVVR